LRLDFAGLLISTYAAVVIEMKSGLAFPFQITCKVVKDFMSLNPLSFEVDRSGFISVAGH
jgi:hypothetical protein